MSRSVNKLCLVGHVGRDPDIRQTANGTKVGNFSVATNSREKRGEEYVERTEWHRVVVWGKKAEFAEQYIKKGDRVYLEGPLQYDSYERDGVTIPTAEMNAREIVLLSPREAGAEHG